MYDKPKSVLLGYIHGGKVHEPFMQSVVDFIGQDAQQRKIFYKLSAARGLYLDVNRNAVASRFLSGPADVLLFVDTDIHFDFRMVYRLLDDLDDEHEIVSGIYFGHGHEGNRLVLYPIWFEKEETTGAGIRRFKYVQSFTPGLQQLGAVGMGFCAIHRNALEKMEKGRWFERLMRENDDTGRRLNYGEDTAFCVRATEAGVSIWGDGSVGVRHIKETALDFESFLKFWDIKPPEAIIPDADSNGVIYHG